MSILKLIVSLYQVNNTVQFIIVSTVQYCTVTFYLLSVLSSGIKQYHLINTLKNWADAQTYCRQYHVDLAMIESATENQEVLNILLENPTAAWIGLYRQPYRWSDGSNSTFRRWDSNQPSGGTEFCASQRSNYYWNDVPCEMKKQFRKSKMQIIM
uniref:C-type lectin domain-containing protein n=1 Tax=Periophthalmus magnuspinnatus TaxID=409849 RepID=A0A3B4A3R0_9GOBI